MDTDGIRLEGTVRTLLVLGWKALYGHCWYQTGRHRTDTHGPLGWKALYGHCWY